MPEDFDMENFTKEVFFMFSGEKVLVDLRCDNSLMKTMVDRFGEDVTTLAYDMTSFRIQTEVSASQTFFGWVFGFNGKVQILGPESVREEDQRIFQISKSKINSNFHKLSDQAGLKRITIHGLRHSHVSLLISKKYDIFEVSKRIGHKSVKTTQDIYGHLFDDVQKSIANDLNMIRRGGV